MKFKKTKQIVFRIIVITLFACMLTGLFHGVVLLPRVFAEDEPATIQIHSAADFAAYSQAYAAGGKNPKDILNISISEGSEISNSGFISLGTSKRPFAGTLVIPTAGIDTFRLFDCPLFNYVSTDLQIGGAGTVKIIRARADEIPATGVLTSGALFANHVVKGTGAASWNISLFPFSGEGTASTSFEGLIGEIADNATVTVTFTNTSNLNVTGSGDLGLICGKLGAGATLNVATAGSGGDLSVTSSGGNAGGLVGKMSNGSTLKFNSANLSRVNSVSSTAGFAGGIVGYANNVTIEYDAGVSDYAVSGTVSGTEGAGGLFGYYKNVDSPVTFGLEKYSLAERMTITSSKYAGGIFGVLENTGASFTFNGNASGSEVLTFVLSGGSNRGGVCGGYTTDSLSNTLTFTNTATTIRSANASSNSGGLIGAVANQPAYITTTGSVSVTVGSGTLTGGLIGTLGSGGSFADLTGTVTITGNVDVGLVGKLPAGVLRLQGVTDLSAAITASAQFVGSRSRSLVYALGDGFGTNGNWTVKRNHTKNAVDDIAGWGQVVRVDGVTLSEGDLFTISGHTVTVKAPVTAMGTVTDFAKTALNVKLNSAAGVGALQFASATRNSTLLSGSLSLSDDIDLSGTGLLGLTRDDGANPAFSGTFDGNGYSLSLAIGEMYGLRGDGSALIATDRQGNIYTHLYNGLFAKTNNATVEDLTVAGTAIIYQKAGSLAQGATPMRMGGIAALANGSLTLTGNTVSFTQDLKVSDDYEMRFGGAVGEASGSVSVTVSGGSYLPVMQDKTASLVADGSYFTHIGGVIGYVSDSAGQSISISNCTVGLDYTRGDNANRASCFGGAIGKIANKEYVQNSRTVSLTNVTTDVTVANGKTNSSGLRFGGILGSEWLSVDVTLNGVILNADIESTASAAVGYGGLVQTATGYWNIQLVEADSVNFTLPDNDSSFGFVANKTYSTQNDANTALYLEVDNTGSNYNIASVTFTGAPAFDSFDELVAFSIGSGADITQNGNSIVSIKTSGNVINTTGSTYNTYLNQTAYGRSVAGAVNPNARYYYNLAYARANVATAKYQFLVWSVKQYAHSSLAAWFTAGNTFTGSLDLTGLSYYPIDLTTGVTFNNVTVKLDNVLMDGFVKYAYYYDDDGVQSSDTRSTRADTNQHYLMHTALFRNVTAGVTISGMTLEGNVPKLSDSFCGFFIAGRLGGSDTAIKFNAADLTFDGVYVTTNAGAYLTDTTYAPLFINKIGKNTTLEIAGAKQNSSYAAFASNSRYAGSSLIGDVGSTTDRAIYLTFSGLKFDSRVNSGNIGMMDTSYGTAKSVFSRSTILNSLLYAGESSGSYNYAYEADWVSASNHNNVTYGKEITASVENAGLQEKYSGSVYYTHPSEQNYTDSEHPYNFNNGNFRPYVYVAYNLAEYKHELAVNITVSGIIEGCGKYGDPYIIDADNKLPIIATMISGTNLDTVSTVQLYLPSDYASCVYTNQEGETSGKYTKSLYTFGDLDETQTNNARKYLAGAYYVITKDITLSSTGFAGLGGTSAEYAFRGVLIGRGTPTVTNESRNPLILTSLGAVIKDLVIDVAVDYAGNNQIELAAATGSDLYAYSGGLQSYGAVIGQILGGDNFIDNVQVTISDLSFNDFSRLTPVGGYVGTLFNGGLIFRNMAAANAEDARFVGLTSTICSRVADAGYLYVNPIIGRVIAGYAFYEGAAYHATEDDATLKNGLKNYTIADLSLSEGKLTVTDADSQFTVTVPDGQAMFILGAAVNSGAASGATGGNLTNNIKTYQTLGNDAGLFWQAYRAHTMVRGGASYSGVGTIPGPDDPSYPDYTQACLDKYTADTQKVPYILRAYTTNDNSCLYLRSLTTRANTIVNVTGNCDVAAGFRGFGSIYLDSTYLRLCISKMTGQIGETTDSYKITLHMRYQEYDHKNVSVYRSLSTETSGFGLFNRLQISEASEENSVQYLMLAGTVYYDVYTTSGVQSTYAFGIYKGNSSNYDREELGSIKAADDNENIINKKTYLSAGGLAGILRNAYYIKNVTFDGLSVEGAKNAGGLVGYIYLGTGISSISYISFADVASTGTVNVTGGLCAGGVVGKIYESRTEISGKSGTGTDLNIGTIALKSQDPNEQGMQYFANINTGLGGVVGQCWAANKPGTGVSADKPIASVTNNSKRLFIDRINVSGGNIRVLNDSGDKFNYAGGYVGSALTVYLKITNSTLKRVNISANIAGGFVGRLTQQYYLEIFNCSAIGVAEKNINPDGSLQGGTVKASITGTRTAGGAIGWCVGRDSLYFQLKDFSIQYYGIESTTTSATMVAAAGGVVGYAEGNNTALNSVNNVICQFNNLTIRGCDIKTNYATPGDNGFQYKVGTGGIIGAIDSLKSSNGNVVPNQSFYSNTSNRDANASNEISNKYKFSGYNILVKDCTLTHKTGGSVDDNTSATNRRIGDLVGNNGAQTPLKLVGVSVENDNDCGKHVGYCLSDDDNYGNSTVNSAEVGTYGTGYVVFANFNGITGGTAFSGVDDSSTSDDNYTDVAAAAPFATVNPTLTIGRIYTAATTNASGVYVRCDAEEATAKCGEYYYRPYVDAETDGGKTRYNLTAVSLSLTGDGTAATVAELAIQNILLNEESGKYKYAAGAYYTGSSGDSNYDAFSASSGKLAMFNTEVSGYLGTNFPVLIVDDINHANTHKMINSYLRLLTNTVHDFGVDKAGEYEVAVYNMMYDHGWKPSSTGASLKRDTETEQMFYMTANSFDSGKTQFSLIDVRFFDPATPSQVAYHLYVPVFVKKVLSYQFDIAVHSGTDYFKGNYTDHFGEALIENTGTPITLFFRYTYTRTNEEWASAINAGESVNRFYAKKLLFNKANNNDVLNDLPGDTVLVLVDPNRGGKPYYATLSMALAGNQLNLSAFREVMTRNGDSVTFSGGYFSPLTFDQMMTLGVESGGTLVEENDLALATVVVAGQGYRLATDEELADGSVDKYSVTVSDSPVVEQYYISAFTESNVVNDLLFHYYLVKSPSSFDEIAFPSRITDPDRAQSMVHLIMGKIFRHENLTIESDSEDGVLLMSDDNRSLTVTLSAQLGLADLDSATGGAVREDVRNLIGSTQVYQGFLLYLNRVEGASAYKAILGEPTGSGSYYIGADPAAAVNYPAANIQVEQNYAQFLSGNLSANFATGNLFVIHADVTLTYSSEAIPTQFPGRNESTPDNGTSVSASSNIGFTAASVTNSKNHITGDESPKKVYYSEADPDIATLDLNPMGDRVGDFTPLGINARNNNGLSFESFDLYAVLNITTISELIADYADAVVTITLGQKESDGTYTAIDDISQYLSVKLANMETLEDLVSPTFTDNGASYSVVVAKASLSDNGADITLPILRFTVKTGAALEAAGLTYGNYRVNVAVELRNGSGTVYPPSRAENFVIYSNVKVIPSFLDS